MLPAMVCPKVAHQGAVAEKLQKDKQVPNIIENVG